MAHVTKKNKTKTQHNMRNQTQTTSTDITARSSERKYYIIVQQQKTIKKNNTQINRVNSCAREVPASYNTPVVYKNMIMVMFVRLWFMTILSIVSCLVAYLSVKAINKYHI